MVPLEHHRQYLPGALTLAILVTVFGPRVAFLIPLVVLVDWPPVELDEHTPALVAAGAAIGAVVAVVVFELVR